MKTCNRLLTICLLVPLSLFGQAKKNKDSTKTVDLARVTVLVRAINDRADQLSVFVSQLSTTRPFYARDWKVIADTLKAIDQLIVAMQGINLRGELDPKNRAEFDSEDLHFTVQEGLVEETLDAFEPYKDRDTLYTAQIDHAESRIERFLAATNNFSQYLQLLGQPAAADIAKKLDSLANALKPPAVTAKDTPRCLPDTQTAASLKAMTGAGLELAYNW